MEIATQSESEKKKEDWMNSKWRPAMGWMYMAVCITDFILYPVLWAIFQAYNHLTPVKPYDPLTLQGAGLFHIAMGAVLGLSAWGRTQEKLNGANNGGLPQPQMSQSVGNLQPSSSASATFGGNPPQVITGYGGKLGPAPEQDPVR